MAGPWDSLFKKKDNHYRQDELGDLDYNPDRSDSSLKWYIPLDKELESSFNHLQSEFEIFDSIYHTDFGGNLDYINKQFDVIKSIIIRSIPDSKPSRKILYDLATAGGRIINELATFDRNLCDFCESVQDDRHSFRETTSVFFDMVIDCLDVPGIEGLLDYPKTIDEFYIKYNLD